MLEIIKKIQLYFARMYDNSFDDLKDVDVLDANKAFSQILKKRREKIMLAILVVAICIFILFKFFPNTIMNPSLVLFITSIPLFIMIMWLAILYSKIRQAFWKQIALKYNWTYTPTKDISREKALLFSMGHSKITENGITGNYINNPFYIFEYQYTIGSGKHSRTYNFTVFEVKFTGTFPHLYLNYKNDWYSNSPSMFSSFVKISLPQEFADKFKLYVPKEYEIEALQIFTPDVFSLLLDSEWDYDMEFVDGELIIYSNTRFGNFVELDNELNKIKKFVDILSPLLNRFQLHKIGDYSSSLR
ncbi:MAG: hypothetical protein WC783_04510 [Candidatus Paceibacterota bacterium]|jgi:protein-S-isoprenylcysteine O-methyltransferase Ste14